MTTETTHVHAPHPAESARTGEVYAHSEPTSGAAGVGSFFHSVFETRAGHFVAHFVEMCLAMCLGFVVLDALILGAAWLIGYADPLQIVGQFPEVATLVVAFNMSAPMATWMRYRGMSWGLIGEMSGAMFVLAIVLIGAAWLGLLPASSLVVLEHGLMMPAMLVPMLLRLDHYTGAMSHQPGSMSHHAHAA